MRFEQIFIYLNSMTLAVVSSTILTISFSFFEEKIGSEFSIFQLRFLKIIRSFDQKSKSKKLTACDH